MANKKLAVTIRTSKKKVWEYFNNPKYVQKWELSCPPLPHVVIPREEDDLIAGGLIGKNIHSEEGNYLVFDIDGSVHDSRVNEFIKITDCWGLKVEIKFHKMEDGTSIEVLFTDEQPNSYIIDYYQTRLAWLKAYAEKQNQ